MRFTFGLPAVILFSGLCGCGPGVFSVPPPPTELHVAAAANLQTIFATLAEAELKATGIRLIASFGSTAQLTHQIEAGAPFDLFLAADNEHPVSLASAGLADSPQEYARGRVVIWAPKHPEIKLLEDLARPDVKVVAIANPDLAPYGHASVEALNAAGLWEKVKPKVVYAQNISAALTFADTGNADAALTAFSLVAAKHPNASLVPANLHRPIVQSLCILKRTSQAAAAHKAAAFILGPTARVIFQTSGYSVP
jgi:molybdate transport system substrate-binding protein